MFCPRTFCPHGRFVLTDVLSAGCFVRRTFCPHRRFVRQMFCHYGCFVPTDVLSPRTFCPQTFCLGTFFFVFVLFVQAAPTILLLANSKVMYLSNWIGLQIREKQSFFSNYFDCTSNLLSFTFTQKFLLSEHESGLAADNRMMDIVLPWGTHFSTVYTTYSKCYSCSPEYFYEGLDLFSILLQASIHPIYPVILKLICQITRGIYVMYIFHIFFSFNSRAYCSLWYFYKRVNIVHC